MAKEWSSDELAWRTFVISMAAIGTFISVVFIFIIL